LSDIRICILDYGSGNVRSLHNALKSLGLNSKISNEVSSITDATHLVLPGVGGFSASMEKINDLLPLDVIRLQISKGKPFLGICVGMQVLCAIGYEHGETLGLNYFEGNIVRFPESTLPVPHVGWNNVAYKPQSALFQKMVANPDFYFVHSFFLDMPTDRPEVAAFTDYILSFPSAIEKDNIFGVQFHPEKSQKNGKILLRNFAGIT
jgi:glutamine amidotransferase